MTFCIISFPLVLCIFGFVCSKKLTTFHFRLVYCDASCRIQFKGNHVILLRKPFQSFFIWIIALSYMFPCHPVCIDFITVLKCIILYRFHVSDCEILQYKSSQPPYSSRGFPSARSQTSKDQESTSSPTHALPHF